MKENTIDGAAGDTDAVKPDVRPDSEAPAAPNGGAVNASGDQQKDTSHCEEGEVPQGLGLPPSHGPSDPATTGSAHSAQSEAKPSPLTDELVSEPPVPPADVSQAGVDASQAEGPPDQQSPAHPGESADAGEQAPGAVTAGDEEPASLEPEAPAPEAAPAAAAPPPRPEWKVLEPEDRSDPVDHEVCQPPTRLGDDWMIMAASVRGKLHAHKALWRDDAYAFDRVDDWTIMAVSDGAGSAKLSRVGARIACDKSVQALALLLSGYSLKEVGGEVPSASNLEQVRAFLAFAACAARDGIVREAYRRKIAEREMYCTLLLLIHTPWKDLDLVASLQVGDGAIGVFDSADQCTLLGDADHGEYSSETVFLTSWKQLIATPYGSRTHCTVKRDVRCIAAMCDGVSDDFFPESKRLIELFIGNPIQEVKTREGEPVMGVMHEVVKEPRDGQAMLDWLKYEKKGSSDDRTLLLMYRD